MELEKYAEVTIKAVAVQERERLVFQRTRPSCRRRRKPRALRDGKGLQGAGTSASEAEASGLGARRPRPGRRPQGAGWARCRSQAGRSKMCSSLKVGGFSFDVHSTHKHLLHVSWLPGTVNCAGESETDKTQENQCAKTPSPRHGGSMHPVPGSHRGQPA